MFKGLASEAKEGLLELIRRYREGQVPLLSPITLMNHYARHYGEPYLAGQLYLHPHPLELRSYHATSRKVKRGEVVFLEDTRRG